MTDDMERLIGAVAPGDSARLAGVEDAVWARIGERRDRARMTQVALAQVAAPLASAAKIAVMTIDFQFALIPGCPGRRAATGRPTR